jgi:hypothetical protein
MRVKDVKLLMHSDSLLHKSADSTRSIVVHSFRSVNHLMAD